MTEVTSEVESLISQASLLSEAGGLLPTSTEEMTNALKKIMPDVGQRAAYLASRTAINVAAMHNAIHLRKKPLHGQTRAVFMIMLVVLENALEMIRDALEYEGE